MTLAPVGHVITTEHVVEGDLHRIMIAYVLGILGNCVIQVRHRNWNRENKNI